MTDQIFLATVATIIPHFKDLLLQVCQKLPAKLGMSLHSTFFFFCFQLCVSHGACKVSQRILCAAGGDCALL